MPSSRVTPSACADLRQRRPLRGVETCLAERSRPFVDATHEQTPYAWPRCYAAGTVSPREADPHHSNLPRQAQPW